MPTPIALLPTAIALGSLNQHKHDALLRAIQRANLQGRLEVIRADVNSGVDEQPIGGDVAALGAENRARDAVMFTARDVRYGIGIESGIELRRGTWLDVATVVIVEHEREAPIAVATSIGLPIPTEDVLATIAAGVRTNTVGGFLARRTGSDTSDWHSTATEGRLSRVEQMAGAIYAALIQVW